jgi:hypothetical protein
VRHEQGRHLLQQLPRPLGLGVLGLLQQRLDPAVLRLDQVDDVGHLASSSIRCGGSLPSVPASGIPARRC